MENHFILCGLGRVGEKVLEHLRAVGTRVVVIDNRCRPDDLRLAGAELVAGDCRRQDVLEQAGLAKARGVLVLPSDEYVSLQTALMVRHLNPSVRVVVRMFNQNLIARLGSSVAGVTALSASGLAAPLLAMIARTGEALGTFQLDDGSRQQIAACKIAKESPLVGQRVDALAANHKVTVLSHYGPSPERLLHEVDDQTLLKAEDSIMVCGPSDNVEALLAQGENESLPELLWAGLSARMARTLWRVATQIDLPVKICTLALIGVILVSTLIFHFGMKNDTLIDAFYRTVSLIATGADMRGQEIEPGGWQKAFISMLRLSGMALIAAFTAIFTNYLVRANLGGALEIRRIPDGGHVIVVGIGNVGYRVVEELLNQGEQVVVIERNRDNPFIATTRRRGAAVIIGNAAVSEVLKQSNAASAKAVVAATSSDLANVEIALLVRELAPKQRVVVRLIESTLATTLRQAANVRLALSIPELVAPAFVAAILGDRVRGLILVKGKLLAVYDLVLREGDAAFLGANLRDLAKTYHFAPLHWAGPDSKEKAIDANGNLAVGDQLTVILSLEDWQHLLMVTR